MNGIIHGPRAGSSQHFLLLVSVKKRLLLATCVQTVGIKNNYFNIITIIIISACSGENNIKTKELIRHHQISTEPIWMECS